MTPPSPPTADVQQQQQQPVISGDGKLYFHRKMPSGTDNPGFRREQEPKRIVRGLADSILVVPESIGSESPRSIRSYHKGSSGTLTGGGIKANYSKQVDMKQYKAKIDKRLGHCLLACIVTIATVLCVYGLIHQSVHTELTTYVNRTHQIANEMKTVMLDDYGKLDNKTLAAMEGHNWMEVEELEHDAYLLDQTHSKIWWLFFGNVVVAILLTPVLFLVHCGFVEGNGFKLVYRIVLLACLIWLFAQFFYLIHPILFGAARFPGMVDRLFVTGYPRDEYQLNDIKDAFSCEWVPDPVLVRFDLQLECLPRIKNSLFPAYVAILLLVLDVFPFIFAIFMYAWSACIKDHKHVNTLRQRVNVNNQRRVHLPRHQENYVPPNPKLIHIPTDKHGQYL